LADFSDARNDKCEEKMLKKPEPLDIPIPWSTAKIKYVLRNLSIFQRGEYPYSAETGRAARQLTAGFVNAVEAAVEAEMRVARAFICIAPEQSYDGCEYVEPSCLKMRPFCRWRRSDGEIVFSLYRDGQWPSHVARLINCETREVYSRASRALRYAASDGCLVETYRSWVKRRHGK
jgi:hypothetical protein